MSRKVNAEFTRKIGRSRESFGVRQRGAVVRLTNCSSNAIIENRDANYRTHARGRAIAVVAKWLQFRYKDRLFARLYVRTYVCMYIRYVRRQ